jgi:hypothetical protein
VPDSSDLKSPGFQWIDQELGPEPIQVTLPSSQLFFCPFEASVCDLVESPKQLRQHEHAIRWR